MSNLKNDTQAGHDARPVLRWSGSKSKLLPELEGAAPRVFNTYIEPFAGSACLFFRMRPDVAILGDVNQLVIDVYRAIKESPETVQFFLDSIPASPEAFYTLREISPMALTLEQRAAQFIYLMKACFNGVYRTNRSGRFNVPLGSRIYSRPSLGETKAVSELLERVSLMAADFEAVLSHAKPGDFVYLDPPYPTTNRYRGEYGYGAQFTQDDKRRLIECVKRLTTLGVKVMISYVEDQELLKLLPGWMCQFASVRRSVSGRVGSRGSVTEIILTNYHMVSKNEAI